VLELLGFVAGTIATGFLSLGQLKRLVFLGCAIVAGVNLFMLSLATNPPIAVLRFFTGAGAGLCFGYGLKLCAQSAAPTRNFGIFTGTMSIMMIVGFQTVAHIVDARVQPGIPAPAATYIGIVRTVLLIYAGIAVLAAAIHAANQPRLPAESGGSAQGLTWPRPVVALGLAAIALAFLGQGGVWAFLQTLGVSHGFSVSGVANAMSMFAIMGVIGSFSAALMPPRLPRWVANALAFAALCIGLYVLYSPSSLAGYMVGCAITGFYWNFVLPLILGLLAKIDSSGQGSVLGGSMSSLGSGFGPVVASILIQQNNYQPVGWLVGSLCLASFLCVWCVETRQAA
jgi:predicted MFS family arabinose efflux permease